MSGSSATTHRLIQQGFAFQISRQQGQLNSKADRILGTPLRSPRVPSRIRGSPTMLWLTAFLDEMVVPAHISRACSSSPM
jgi:hypothetical protein